MAVVCPSVVWSRSPGRIWSAGSRRAGLIPVEVVGGAGDGGGSLAAADGDVGVVAVGVGDVNRGNGVGLVLGAGVGTGQVVGDLIPDLDLVDGSTRAIGHQDGRDTGEAVSRRIGVEFGGVGLQGFCV